MNKLDGKSLDLEKINIEKIKDLFPQVVTEGKIDFDKLRLILGDEVEEEVEKYQFTWNGKSKTIKLAQTPSTGTLIPSKEDGKNWDTTENLYIEGDNLEVLKLLQKTYYGKIKMIYIDPPYNTGGDFVYKDDFKDNIKNYKEQTNQTTRANPETSGRFHTDWLNMMYSRILLSKNLLSDDGIIFISIDDREIDNLSKIMNEIFGEDSLISKFIWKKTSNPNSTKNNVGIVHEYIICYYKNVCSLNLLPLSKEDIEKYQHKDEYFNLRGPYKLVGLNKTGTLTDKRPNLQYEIIAPDGTIILPKPRWRWSKETFEKGKSEGRLVFKNNNGWTVYYKQYLFENNSGEEIERGNLIETILDTYGRTTDGTLEVNGLIGKSIFDFPKPTSLIKHLLTFGCDKKGIVLDFFSGSSTTAHAVMQLNAEDGGNRKFIMVQLPELTDESSEAYKAGYKNICEIGKERIRRAGDQIKQELIDKKTQAGILDEDITDPDTFDNGFKVFKLESTNINPWDGTARLNEDTLLSHLEVIKSDRTKQDVLYEIMLKYGVFDKPVDEVKINGKTMFSIAMGYLIVCLEDNIKKEDILEIGKLKPKNVIFKESGFSNDNDKINATYTLEKLGVEEIKCI